MSNLRFLPLFILLFFCSCRNVQVVESIDQNRAHKIVTQLNSFGINSYIEDSKTKGVYNILVKQSNRLSAIKIITEAGLLPQEATDFQKLTEPQGFMPNSKAVENLRLDRAIAVEIQEALESHPDIRSAKVIARINSLPKSEQPAVSVMINVADPEKLDSKAVFLFVKNIVPGIDQNHLSILIDETAKNQKKPEIVGITKKAENIVGVTLVPFLIWQVPAGADYELAIAGLLFLIAALCLGFLLGFFIWRRNKTKEGLINLPEGSVAALGIEQSDLKGEV